MKHIRSRRVFSMVLTVAFAVSIYVLYFKVPLSDDEQAVSTPTRFAEDVVVIDAGHGGEDGGAVSISGAVESQLNLSIARRLDAVFGLFGVNAVLLRNSDTSLHDSNAKTIREKKVSDLHNRVETIESLGNPVVISVHQNTFSDSRYHGAQVFYANGDLSLPFAQITQETLRQALNPDNNRKPTAVPGTVYLMNHISCCAILVECGFLSNPQEDILLQSPEYQTKLAAALAGAYLKYQQITQEGESMDAS